jgi:hypothetical protein
MATGETFLDPGLRRRNRKLDVIMHAMWRNGTIYVGDPSDEQNDINAWNAGDAANRENAGRAFIRDRSPHR